MKKFVQKHINKAKNKYYREYFEQYKHDSRKQWSMINNLLNRKQKMANVAKLIDENGNNIKSPKQIAENFNNYFVNIASDIKHQTRNTNAGEPSNY